MPIKHAKKSETVSTKVEKNNVDPEVYLYAKLRRKHAKDYRDPLLKGLDAMAVYVDVLMDFLQRRYPLGNKESRPTLNGLVATEIAVNIGERGEVNVTYDYRNGRTIIWIPKIPGESQEEEEMRRIRIAQHAWPSLPAGIFEVLVDVIRGMPQPSLDRMVFEYEKRFRRHEGRKSKNGK